MEFFVINRPGPIIPLVDCLACEVSVTPNLTVVALRASYTFVAKLAIVYRSVAVVRPVVISQKLGNDAYLRWVFSRRGFPWLWLYSWQSLQPMVWKLVLKLESLGCFFVKPRDLAFISFDALPACDALRNTLPMSRSSIAIKETRGQSNLTKSASRGAHSPVRGHPRGSKVVPLNSWGRVSY